MRDNGKNHPNTPDVVPDYVDMPENPAKKETDALPVPEPDIAGVSRLREGECSPNVPDVKPEMVKGDEDVKIPDEPPPPETVTGLEIPRWLRWSYLLASLLLIAVFGLFLFGQAISSLALASSLPVWAQYLLLIPLGFCALIVLGVVVSLIWSWIRLWSIRQVNLAAMEELRSRARTRRDGLEHFQSARLNLEQYLGNYPLVGRDAGKLLKAGLTVGELDAMHRDREYLTGRETDSKSWLDEFQTIFQARLDKAAARRVDSWSLKAAGCVMASPLPFLDAILILSIALRMIRDLCLLYNVRTGASSSLLLLTRAIRNAFVAGVAGEAANMAGEMAGDEIAGFLGDTALGTVSSSFARILAPKLGEGTINALFMRRLGRAAIRILQPLRGA